MNSLVTPQAEAAEPAQDDAEQEQPDTAAPNQSPLRPLGRLAAYVQRAGAGERAALARLDPQAMRPHQVAALSRALISAGLRPETWRSSTWPRWALVAKGIALAGHDGAGRLGEQLARADVTELRVTTLLTSRGEAFRQMLPRLLRLLASRGVSPNWFELGPLALKEGSSTPEDLERAEQLRLRIAGAYFAARSSGHAAH